MRGGYKGTHGINDSLLQVEFLIGLCRGDSTIQEYTKFGFHDSINLLDYPGFPNEGDMQFQVDLDTLIDNKNALVYLSVRILDDILDET
jgi:hypothetical protein